MDVAGPVECVVEIQRMAHRGIDHGCLRRREFAAKQQEAAVFTSAPMSHHTSYLGNTWRQAPAQGSAHRIQDVPAGGAYGLHGEVSKGGSTDMVGQGVGGINRH